MHIGMCHSCCVTKGGLQRCARCMQEYVSEAVLCAKVALPVSYVVKGKQRKGCAIELHTQHVLFNAHVSAAVVLHCLCNLRVLQTCSMCLSKQCGSGGTDSSSSISAGANARTACMQTFAVACPAYLRVIPTLLSPVLSESAARQQHAVGQDRRRSHYSATRRHSTATVKNVAVLEGD
jgi:hypothetical protein